MARIGQTVSKPSGRTPHGHRHAYGRRLSNANVDPLIIKKALHHSSLASQSVYTQPGIRDVTQACDEAASRLDSQIHADFRQDVELSWKEIMKTGFEDIDPDGFFSGKYPKFR